MDKMIAKGVKVDAIITDPPYGQTKNKWDSVIPFDEMWKRLNNIVKPNGAIILFGQGLFTANLMNSNPKKWRYNLIWDKVLPGGFLNANRMPLRSHEDIIIFYNKLPNYNPQKVLGNKSHSKGKSKECDNNNYGDYKFIDNSDELGELKHPKSILSFPKPHPSIMIHPTQKSTEIFEWLIKSYTNEDELVLDFTSGSFTTGVACQNTNRKFIGIELDENYFNIGVQRMKENYDKLTEVNE